MVIFLDLDETLVHAIPGRKGNPGARFVVTCKDGTTFWVRERPIAKRIIADCRALGIVRILTGSTFDYASEVCQRAGFDFEPSDILSQEAFVVQNGEKYEPARCETCPQAFLIDNAEPRSIASKLKMQFLGIPLDRYLRFRTFRGGRESRAVDEEWTFLFSSFFHATAA